MKSTILLLLIVLCTSCASEKKVFYKEYSHTCYQQKNPSDPTIYNCASLDDTREPYKWHRVRPWDSLGDMPDLP